MGNGVPEILIGRQWLKSRRLLVDMLSGILTLGNGGKEFLQTLKNQPYVKKLLVR